MSHQFETVADVFPEKNVTPYMAMTAASGEPQWFATLHGLIEHVKDAKGPVWVDVGDGTASERRKLFALLSHGVQVPASALDAIVDPTEGDTVELQSGAAQYVWGTLACAAMSRGVNKDTRSAAAAHGEVESNGSMQSGLHANENDMVLCGFFVSEQVAITFHSAPFLGLSETLWRMTRFVADVAAAAPAAAHGVTGARPCFTSALLASLMSFTCEAALPDAMCVMTEVDTIDEMVLLIAPGKRDQSDLLRRISIVRRRIAAMRKAVHYKERLLQDMLTPKMRACFVCAHADTTSTHYRDTLEKVLVVIGRLTYMHDTLNQANLNFVTGASMRMTQISASMDVKMQIFNAFATIFLPLHFTCSLMGMNTRVPYQKDRCDTLGPFFVIIAIMFVWVVVCCAQTFRDVLFTRNRKQLVPLDE